MHLIDSVRRTIRRYGLLPRDSRVVVALSGGADSVALLLGPARDRGQPKGFTLAGAAHLNHQLRGTDADADEEFCRRLSAELDVPLHVERIDVAALARVGGVSLEQAAHDARHEFFARAAAARSMRRSSPSRTRKTIRRRRFCCGCCVERVRAA